MSMRADVPSTKTSDVVRRGDHSEEGQLVGLARRSVHDLEGVRHSSGIVFFA